MKTLSAFYNLHEQSIELLNQISLLERNWRETKKNNELFKKYNSLKSQQSELKLKQKRYDCIFGTEENGTFTVTENETIDFPGTPAKDMRIPKGLLVGMKYSRWPKTAA